MELNVWSSDWGLASVDPACLSMMAYAKFSGAPVSVRHSNNPFWSPKGRLPVFQRRQPQPDAIDSNLVVETIVDFRELVEHLRDSGYSADYNLSARQASEVTAYSSLMEDKLSPALLHLFWVDAKNQVELTRPWFAGKMGLPLSLFYPNKFVNHAHDVVQGHVDLDVGVMDPSLVESAIYKRAEECLSILARRLGDEPYFFGKSPSSLDALVYGLLAPLLKAPLPNPALQNHLKACGNLVAFVVRITQNYFSQTSVEFEKRRAEKAAAEAALKKANGGGGLWAKASKVNVVEWLRPLFAAAVGGVAMLGYAYSSGIIDQYQQETSRAAVNYDDDDED